MMKTFNVFDLGGNESALVLKEDYDACAAGPWRPITDEDRVSRKTVLIFDPWMHEDHCDVDSADYVGSYKGNHMWLMGDVELREKIDWLIADIKIPSDKIRRDLYESCGRDGRRDRGADPEFPSGANHTLPSYLQAGSLETRPQEAEPSEDA